MATARPLGPAPLSVSTTTQAFKSLHLFISLVESSIARLVSFSVREKMTPPGVFGVISSSPAAILTKSHQVRGSTIGTGLFLGTSSALVQAGPLGLLFSFSLISIGLYSVTNSLAELLAHLPSSSSPSPRPAWFYTSHLAHPSLGFAVAWTTWLVHAATLALELVAIAPLLQHWEPVLWPNGSLVAAAAFWLFSTTLILLPNCWSTFALNLSAAPLKLFVALLWLSIAFCISAGVGQEAGPGFQYWSDPGGLVEHIAPKTVDRSVGVGSVLAIAAFSLQGGIMSLTLATVFSISLLVPSDDPDIAAYASTFVVAVRRTGIPFLPELVNALLVISVMASANAHLASGSRILTSLAGEGYALPLGSGRTNGADGAQRFSAAATSAVGFFVLVTTLVCNAGVVLSSLLLGAGGSVAIRSIKSD
ncbi:hypothetical protein SODALDRAFT_379393 [Sodiomyces alkalinus F11]|uniref:Amino acid permease/ SLC12A domain-containing protein n=1 Tax=Sodiomyces alkalinus (strain CBS 110278 / VKM F-3762 / F11) TaxID=1314773 RepID=A0A3N2PUI6_SODAK|nr:hypothetical protein SODALDRAFT_379393 [Sodiomyces alkalinus F11]ROT38188.1 hypothetical protein SODALDRAFT_379393 [Sodiomyces alkalinus F11]